MKSRGINCAAKRVSLYAPYAFFAFFCLIFFAREFGNMDELWNYNFAANIANGKIPYRDFSIVQTPLSAYIPAALMRLFGRGLFVLRIAGTALLYALSMLVYRSCKRETESAFFGFILALLAVGVNLPFYIYNYNYLSALIILTILEIDVIADKRETLAAVVTGLLVGLLPLVKQNTGAMLMVANFVICVLGVFKYKKSKKLMLARVALSMVPICVFLIYMCAVGAIGDFFDYAVFGIGTFVHRTTPIDMIKIAPVPAIFELSIMVGGIACIIFGIRKKRLTMRRMSGLLFLAAWFSVTYPLFDAHHLSTVLFVLFSVASMFADFKSVKTAAQYFLAFLATVVAVIGVAIILPSGDWNFSSLDNYEHIPIGAKNEQAIRIIDEYILEKRREGYAVRFAFSESAAYTIPLNEYEKNWDMMLVGNIGMNTVSDLLDSTPDKCLFLVYRHYEELGIQEHYELIEHVVNNYEKIDEVLGLDVYEKK